jgi:hypothetical protein
MLSSLRLLSLVIALDCAPAATAPAQPRAAVQTNEGRDEIKVLTEEARIPFTALDETGAR